MKHALAACFAAALLCPDPCPAQVRSLTFEEALALARQRTTSVAAAVAVGAAAGRVEEARARLLPAARRLREDPVLELAGGPRRSDGSSTDYEIAVSQGLEPGARRRARLAGAGAAVDTAEAELADVRRLYLGAVAGAFVRALGAAERLRLTTAAAAVDGELLATAERRYDLGETTALDLNRARIASARASALRGAAEASRLEALGELRARLGLGPAAAIAPAGRLEELPAYDLDALLAHLDERPDLRALDASLQEAAVEIQLGLALGRPSFGLRAGWRREERAEIATAGVVLALPLAGQGREERAVGEVRSGSLRAQLAAARQAAAAEVRAAHEAYGRRRLAALELERTALPAVEDDEGLARRSFEAGEINLGELLAIRREILETRLLHLDLTIEARLAAIDLETRAGAMR